jgi:hypothetical protein
MTRNFSISVKAAADAWGMYGTGSHESDHAWKLYTQELISRLDFATEPMETILAVLDTLADKNVCIGSFWLKIFESSIDARMKAEKHKLSDIIKLVGICNKVDYRSNVVIGRLVGMLLENENIWALSPSDLVSAAQVVSSSMTQNGQLFTEIGNRVCMEIEDFSNEQLIAIMTAFSKIKLTNTDMFKSIMRRFTSHAVFDEEQRISVAHVLAAVRFRSDTFFKNLCRDILNVDAYPGQLASVAMSMKKLKIHSGNTEWWSKEDDYGRLVASLATKLSAENIARLNAKELSNCCLLVGKDLKLGMTNHVMDRIKFLLVNDPLSRSHMYLASILEGLARQEGHVHVDHLRWVAEWLCGNVYILPVHDVVSVNRALSKLGFKDHNYHKIWKG